jgi:glycosyltransferase involved in cell wall biosynthesis
VSSESIRILVLGDSRSFHIERYLGELRRQGCEVLLASLEPGHIEYYQLQWKGPIRKLHYRRAVPEVRSLIENYKPDVVDAHFASGYGHIAALALKKSILPLVVQLWGSDILIVPNKSILHKKKTITALKRANAVVADSKYLLSEAEKLHSVKERIIEAFGIEQKYIEAISDKSGLSKPVKIIVPRAHEKVYNNLFVLKAVSGLLNAGAVTITFPDFGSKAEEFRGAWRRLDCRGVKFYQRMDRDSFMKLMMAHEVYLSASWSDSSPVSLIEAMGLGLIPVVAETPGIKEWADIDSAYLFSPSDADSLVNALESIIHDQAKVEGLRICNQERVKRSGIFEENVRARISLMKSLINKS